MRKVVCPVLFLEDSDKRGKATPSPETSLDCAFMPCCIQYCHLDLAEEHFPRSTNASLK